MKVTIITITFNAGVLLDKTASSILGQTGNDYEYLIIDGCSTDDTLQRIQAWKEQFDGKHIPMRWISEKDSGIYDAMNKGLRQSEGDYVWFVNAGDTLHDSSVLSALLESIETNHEPDFLYGETLIVDDEGKVMGERRLKAPLELNWKSFRMGMLVCHQSMLVKRSIAPFYDLKYRYSSDFDWTVRTLRKCNSIQNTGLILSHFLDGGVSKKKMKASLKERFQIMSINYGLLPTTLRHLWFITRAAWFKLRHGWI